MAAAVIVRPVARSCDGATGVGGGLPDGFAVSYDAGGNPTNVTYPNGVTAVMGFNTVGALMNKQYKDSAGANIASWSQTRDGWGRVSTAAGPSSQGARATGFGYDTAGRLTTANDLTGANCVTRGYGFDTASDRLTKTVTTGTATAGVCPTGTTTSTTTGAFNTASQLTSTTITGAGAGTGSYLYDGLGRTTTVPGIDTNNPAGENLSLGFYSTDKPATQTIGATVQSFGLDPVGRTDTTTVTTATGATTTASAFDGGGDSPAWTSTTGGSWTRFIDGPGGALALQATGTGTEPTSANLMLINPHGDITATIPDTTNVTAAQISGINDTDEYGVVTSSPTPTPYGWVGAAQRSTADQGGLIQMGARQYNPATGRFLTLDPTPGGNPNPYTYPVDPVNGSDLSGQFSFGGFLSSVVAAATAPIRAVVNIAQTVIHTATHYTRAAASYVRQTAAMVYHAVHKTITSHSRGGRAGTTAAISPVSFLDPLQKGRLLTGFPDISRVSLDISACAGPCFGVTVQGGKWWKGEHLRFAWSVGGAGLGASLGNGYHLSDSGPQKGDVTCGGFASLPGLTVGITGTDSPGNPMSDGTLFAGLSLGFRYSGGCMVTGGAS